MMNQAFESNLVVFNACCYRHICTGTEEVLMFQSLTVKLGYQPHGVLYCCTLIHQLVSQ